jgi:hypothetical protein
MNALPSHRGPARTTPIATRATFIFIGVNDRTIQTKPGQNDENDATVFGKEAELLKCMLMSWKLQ